MDLQEALVQYTVNQQRDALREEKIVNSTPAWVANYKAVSTYMNNKPNRSCYTPLEATV